MKDDEKELSEKVDQLINITSAILSYYQGEKPTMKEEPSMKGWLEQNK